ncbi:MAG: hypothetical protein M5U29_17325 [Anaerolineae bacterium]|nr:hypothetical protein [Anaerolineae bacterium]
MSQELRQCPHCGAYVLSGDAICPRCDHPLEPADDRAAPDPPTAIFSVPEEEGLSSDPQTVIFPASEEGIPPDPQTAVFPETEEAEAPAEHPVAAESSAPRLESEPPDAILAPEHEEARPQPPEVTPGPTEEAPAARDEDSGGVPAPDFTALFPPEEVEAEARLPFQDTDRRAPEAVREDTPTHLAGAEHVAPPAGPELEPLQERTQITPSRQIAGPGYIVPPAPYTPPPVVPPAALPMPAAYGPALASGHVYLQQRVAAYVQGGYRVHSHTPAQAVLSCGKNLGVGGWMLALITVIGFAWYLLILTLSGFTADRVYITLEADGRVYEDGPGAAHIRRGRARTGRRWALFGGAVLALSLLLALVLGAVAVTYLRDDGHQAALREAYPAITLFEERFSDVKPDPDDVPLARDGLVVWVVLAGIAAVGAWGGATLAVIGTVHHGAYRVSVPSLPGW